MKFCESCGAKLLPGQKFCEECGATINDEDEIFTSKNTEITSNIYCETCGTKLVPGSLFCENCGAKISNNIETSTEDKIDITDFDADKCIHIFENRETWKEEWERENRKGVDTGIILCDCTSFYDFSFDFVENDYRVEEFNNSIINFAKKAYERNHVKYFLLNVTSLAILEELEEDFQGGDPEEIINMLITISKVARPSYIFILGDEDSIPKIRWDCCNQFDDNDKYICSDLCYATLDTTSPLEGQKYDPSTFIKVGRLVNSNNNPIVELLNSYTERMDKDIDELKTFGVTAKDWVNTSHNIFKRFCKDGEECLESPELNLNTFCEEIQGEENLLFFNLHGSNDKPSYIGQSGGNFPDVTIPEYFGNFVHPFIMGVEACFGGNFNHNSYEKDNTVAYCLYSNCMSILASDCIAYGAINGSMECADIVVGRFLQDMKTGYNAGTSYINALKELLNSEDDAIKIKTLAEFALYGDPSYKRSSKIDKNGNLFANTFIPKLKKGIRIPIPDVRRAINISLCRVDAKISNLLIEHVATHYEGFENSEPSFFEQSHSHLKIASFKKDTDFGKNYLKIFFDKNGKIVKEVISK